MLDILQQYLNAALPSLSSNLPTLLLFTVVIFLYAIAIYAFYRFVAARDTFGFNLAPFRKDAKKGKGARLFNFALRVLEYGFVLPIIVFIWFAGFSLMLFMLSKGMPMEQILFIAITVVSAIRITAYCSENLSKDLAKLLPLVLLAIAITEPSFFSIELIKARIAGLGIFVGKIFAFVLFAIAVEWSLRILLSIKRALFGFSQKDKEEAERELKGLEERLAEKA